MITFIQGHGKRRRRKRRFFSALACHWPQTFWVKFSGKTPLAEISLFCAQWDSFTPMSQPSSCTQKPSVKKFLFCFFSSWPWLGQQWLSRSSTFHKYLWNFLALVALWGKQNERTGFKFTLQFQDWLKWRNHYCPSVACLNMVHYHCLLNVSDRMWAVLDTHRVKCHCVIDIEFWTRTQQCLTCSSGLSKAKASTMSPVFSSNSSLSVAV